VNLVDIVVLALVVLYGFNGFRTGAIVGVGSLVGLALGAYGGAQLVRLLVADQVRGTARLPLTVIGIFIGAGIGQTIAAVLARRLRRQITSEAGRKADSVGGSVVSIFGILVVAWMLAAPLASAPYPPLSAAVRGSGVLRATDALMPAPIRDLSGSLRKFVNDSGFPQVFDAFAQTKVVDVPAPDPALLNSPGVQAVRGSVLKIRGTAPSCDRGIEGSGFVFAPQHVMTNAHVVAGTTKVSVEVNGQALAAKVVVYNPDRDIAVLYVPSLTAPPIAFASAAAASGADAIVVGYPQDGPFDVEPARVRDRASFVGRDIYDSSEITRDVYRVRATVRSGNSGGPLISSSGQVLGVVFAAAIDSSDTGYVLTASEVAGAAEKGRTATAAVSTKGCA
jgi:S1-C subfamily serine protease